VDRVDVDLAMVFRGLVRLEIELWNRLDARLKTEHGLEIGRFEIMWVISQVPGCRVIDIAEELSITVGGVSKVVDRIEAAGWVRRRPNPDDGRSNRIELTRTGQHLLRAADATFRDELAALLSQAMPEGDLAELGRQVRRLRQALALSGAGIGDEAAPGAQSRSERRSS
jgi:DNA-binding MarR family transcriptional regulator